MPKKPKKPVMNVMKVFSLLLLFLSFLFGWKILSFFLEKRPIGQAWQAEEGEKQDTSVVTEKSGLDKQKIKNPPSFLRSKKSLPANSNRWIEQSVERNNEQALAEDASLIQFEVDQDGFAVAFGDVILGEPEEGTKLGKNLGLYRPDAPQFWTEFEIPYWIDPKLPSPDRVLSAISYFHENTRLRFVPFQNQKDAIIFEIGTDQCTSFLGKVGGHQPIRLSTGCGVSEILHEMMHALGFIHEHSRTDRDQFITIYWDNIDAKYRNQFDRVPPSWMIGMQGTPFDYESIMLYRENSFVKRADLFSMKGIGQMIRPSRDRLSTSDLERISRWYR